MSDDVPKPDNLSVNNGKEWFDNHGLFSDHFLHARLLQWEEWQIGTELNTFRQQLLSLYASKKDILPNLNEAQTEDEFIKPVLDLLGYSNSYIVQAPAKKGKQTSRPDYVLFPDEGAKNEAYLKFKKKEKYYAKCIGIADAKYWERDLDLSKSNERDTFSNLNPSFQIINYLIGTQQDWGILTNGRLWRFYSMKSHDHMGDYYQIDMTRLLDAPLEKLKYFYLFFRKAALLQIGGKSFLDRVFEGSNAYAVELEADIKERAYEVVELLCRGFAAGFLPEQLTPPVLEDIYEGSLILLYRLLFIFYAEARELLPLTASADYRNSYSIRGLTEDIAEKDKKAQEPSNKTFDCYDYLHKLSYLIDTGDHTKGVPEYNGGLFEPQEHQFLEKQTIADSFLIPAIRHLAWVKDKKLGRVVSVDYNTLTERHLGSIYEGLLEFKPRIASCDLVLVKEKSSEKYAPAKDYPGKSVKYYKAALYLANDKGERKATGSYYTPEYIVNYIVENTLNPLVKEAQGRVKALKPEVDKAIAKWEKLKKEKQGMEPVAKYDSDIAKERERLLEPYLSLKVLDPAMGSGHFLARATDFLAEAIATDPSIELPKETTGETELTYYRRRVVESCIYGVDLNPLAVELAKLTLWLSTMAKSKPLSFLNHHLRVGNSLIGAKITDLDEIPKAKGKKAKSIDLSRAPVQLGLFQEVFNKKLYDLLQNRALIAQIPTETLEDVHNKEKWEQAFEHHAERFRTLADLWISTHFGNSVAWHEYNTLIENLQSLESEWTKLLEKESTQKAIAMREEMHSFHWELEFPEVFYDDKGNHKLNLGFDAIIGNPPYVELTEVGYGHLLTESRNLYDEFMRISIKMLRTDGMFGFIHANSAYCQPKFKALRDFLKDETDDLTIVNFAIRPQPVFKGVMQRTAITICRKSSSGAKKVKTSRYIRLTEENRDRNLADPPVHDSSIFAFKFEDFVPKIGNDTDYSIFTKLLANARKIGDIIGTNGKPVFYHDSGESYWTKALSYKPEGIRNGHKVEASQWFSMKVNQRYADFVISAINSTLFYWFWLTTSDCRHLTQETIKQFPIPDESLFTEKVLQDLSLTTSNLMEAYKKNSYYVEKREGYESLEFKVNRCKEVINQVDQLVGRLYALTDNEINYLKEYDLDMRMEGE